MVHKISTGDPSTLGTYLKIAEVFGKEAEDFVKKKIAEAKDGENAVVIQAKSQMLYLFRHLVKKEVIKMKKNKCKVNLGILKRFLDVFDDDDLIELEITNTDKLKEKGLRKNVDVLILKNNTKKVMTSIKVD